MTTLIVDADGIAFEAAAAVQKTFQWDDGVFSTVADLNEAMGIVEDKVAVLIERFTAKRVFLCWSCPTRRYFRHDLLPTYKSGRHGAPLMVLKDLKTWAQGRFPSKLKPGLEADDVVGILATHPKLIPGEKIVVSPDKDLRQIPGTHFNPDKPDDGLFEITACDAEKQLWMQTLTGDSTDNFSGIPGIGPKRAEAILAKRRQDEPYEAVVLEAYLKAGLTAADMEVQHNVARILQAHHYDFKKKEPILWRT